LAVCCGWTSHLHDNQYWYSVGIRIRRERFLGQGQNLLGVTPNKGADEPCEGHDVVNQSSRPLCPVVGGAGNEPTCRF